MSLRNKAISGFFWTAVQQFSRQGISFVVSVILARILLPEEFGLIAMIGILLNLGTSMINSGLTQSLIRTQDTDQTDYSTVFFFNLGASVIIYALVYALAPLVAQFYDQPILTPIIRLYSVTFVINAVSAIQTTRLSKIMDFKTQMKVSVPSLILGSITGIVMALNGFGVWSLVWSAIVQATASSLQLWIYSRWTPSLVFDVAKFKRHFTYGVRIMMSSVLNIFFNSAYTIVIGKFFAPAQVAFYNRAETLQMLPVTNISIVVNRITFTLFSSIQSDAIRLKSAYKRIMQMVIYITAPVLILMAVLAEPLFRFLFTEKWLPAVPYFQILCANGILFPIHEYNLQILNVKGRSDLFLKLELFKKVIIVAVIAATFPFGIFALLYGSVGSSVLFFLINTYYSGKFINYPGKEQALDLLPFIAMAGAAGMFTYGVDYLLSNVYTTDLVRLVIAGLSGVGIYGLLSRMFKVSAFFELKSIGGQMLSKLKKPRVS